MTPNAKLTAKAIALLAVADVLFVTVGIHAGHLHHDLHPHSHSSSHKLKRGESLPNTLQLARAHGHSDERTEICSQCPICLFVSKLHMADSPADWAPLPLGLIFKSPGPVQPAVLLNRCRLPYVPRGPPVA
jgi:hypothetical protein